MVLQVRIEADAAVTGSSSTNSTPAAPDEARELAWAVHVARIDRGPGAEGRRAWAE